MANWELVTETPAVLHAVSQFFGFVYQKVPEDSPPSIDWLTGKPLTYDIDHSDGYVLISAVVRSGTPREQRPISGESSTRRSMRSWTRRASTTWLTPPRRRGHRPKP